MESCGGVWVSISCSWHGTDPRHNVRQNMSAEGLLCCTWSEETFQGPALLQHLSDGAATVSRDDTRQVHHPSKGRQETL